MFTFYFIPENMRHSIVSNIQAKANKGRSKGAIEKITQSNTYTSNYQNFQANRVGIKIRETWIQIYEFFWEQLHAQSSNLHTIMHKTSESSKFTGEQGDRLMKEYYVTTAPIWFYFPTTEAPILEWCDWSGLQQIQTQLTWEWTNPWLLHLDSGF